MSQNKYSDRTFQEQIHYKNPLFPSAFSILRSNLGKRILLLVLISMLLMLVAFAISGWLAIGQTSERVWNERQALAHAISKYLDYILASNLEGLENFRFASDINLEDNNLEPEKKALHSLYLNYNFDGGVFITDNQGNVLWAEPQRPSFVGTNISQYKSVTQTVKTGRTAVTSQVDTQSVSNEAILVTTPIHNQEGQMVGLVGGQIDPAGRIMREIMSFQGIDKGIYVDVVDNEKNIIISTDLSRIAGVMPGNQSEVTVYSQLTYTPWSVAIRQSENSLYAPLRDMEIRLIVSGVLSLVIILLLSWGMTRSIIKPLKSLSEAAQSIAQGNLSNSIPKNGNDEIGKLSQNFESMRIALKRSLEEVRQLNLDLESKVQRRTQQLAESYREIQVKELARGELLRKLFSAQEDERKRIARELHDETSQALNGMVMRLEAALATPDKSTDKMKNLLLDTENLAIRAVDNVHKIIFDLRPAVLDDLGLLPALRWYIQNRLKQHNIKVRVEVSGQEKKLSDPVENMTFRIVQEAVNNIARHSEALNVLISVEYAAKFLKVEIEDDGKGFVVKPFNQWGRGAQGLGLLGMKERVFLLGGELKIESQPGQGTHISVNIPL